MKTLILILSLSSSLAFSLTGLEIMKKAEKMNEGFKGETNLMTMTLIDTNNNERVRSLEGQTLENNQNGNKSMITFVKPADVSGTKLLTWINKGEQNNQWIFLPKFKRVKKIKSSNQSNSFMGSEFTYEDIAGTDIEKYTFELLKEEMIGAEKAWVIEQTPLKKSGYSKVISWISQKHYNPLKAEYYDRKNELLKTSNVSDYKSYKVNGKDIVRAQKISMKNNQTRKQSIITWTDRKIGVKFNESNFVSESLKE